MRKIIALTLLFSLIFSAVGYASNNINVNDKPLVVQFTEDEGEVSNEYFNIEKISYNNIPKDIQKFKFGFIDIDTLQKAKNIKKLIDDGLTIFVIGDNLNQKDLEEKLGIEYLGEVKLNNGCKVKAIGYKKGLKDIYLKEFILYEENYSISQKNLYRLMDNRANGVNKIYNKISADELSLNREPAQFVANSLSDSGNWTLKSANTLTWTYSPYGDFTQSSTVKKLQESNSSYDWYYIWHDNYQLAGYSKYDSSYQNEKYYHKMNASSYSNQQFFSARPNNTGINVNTSVTLGVSATGANGSVSMGISTADTTITNNCDPASKYAAWTVDYTRGTPAAKNTHATETTFIVQKANGALPLQVSSENKVTWENSLSNSVTKTPGYSHFINS